jgi:hypothetical protein
MGFTRVMLESPMAEKIATVTLHINPILLRDAKLVAGSLDIEPERFLVELLESQVATWRMKKQIPVAKTKRKKLEVH